MIQASTAKEDRLRPGSSLRRRLRDCSRIVIELEFDEPAVAFEIHHVRARECRRCAAEGTFEGGDQLVGIVAQENAELVAESEFGERLLCGGFSRQSA